MHCSERYYSHVKDDELVLITIDKIKVDGVAGIKTVLDYRMLHIYGEHGRAWLQLQIDESNFWEDIQQFRSGVQISVSLMLEDKVIPFFQGYPESSEIIYKNGFVILALSLISATVQLDQSKKNRFFQDINMTYQDVVNEVLTDTPYARGICLNSEERIMKPIIQYEESNWEFLLRLASHLNQTLLPDVIKGIPMLYLGFLESGKQAEYYEADYKVGVSENYYKLSKYQSKTTKQDFCYYEILWEEDYDIGDQIIILGKPFYICEKECYVKRQTLVFRYVLAKKAFVSVNKRYNHKLAGLMLKGTVIKTDMEWIQLHLEIDDKQDLESAFCFPWVPETGNLFYCMPLVGTKVNLYIGERDEQSSAKVIHSIRTNSDNCSDLSDTQNRYFTSEHGKRLSLLPEVVGFKGADVSADLRFEIEDERGITIQSYKNCSITAKDTLIINGERIQVFAPKQITAIKSNESGDAVLNICNQFDVIGKVSSFSGNERKKYPPLRKENIKKKSKNTVVCDECVEAALGSLPSGLGNDSLAAVALRGIPVSH